MAEKRKSKKRKEEYGAEKKEVEKASKQEYAVAKWLRNNVPTKKTKFLNHHVEYFTGSRAVDALLASKWATDKSPLFTTRHDVTDFLDDMLRHKFFHRAKKVPVSEQELKSRSKKKEGDKSTKSCDEASKDKDAKEEKTQATANEGKDAKDKDKDKRKRKVRLEMHLEQMFVDSADAYVWIYEPIPVHYWLAGLALLLAAIGVCLFPLWPATVRMGVYYLSIAGAGFLVFIVLLAILRVVVFCIVWTLTLSRHHLWLLPNLVEDVGFFESFWPLYHYEYRGPSAAAQTKPKKKRKKEKNSDDEAEDVPPAPPASQPPQPPQDKPEESEKQSRESDSENSQRDSENSQRDSENSQRDSENSQRSSTDRDFEMVDSGDVDTS